MRRALFLVPALLAAFVLAAPSFGKQAEQAEPASSSAALPALELRALDSRLIPVVLSGQSQRGGAALVTARSQGLLVAQGKVRVLVQARVGHVTGARTAVRLAGGSVVIATGKLIEALVPPKSLRGLALSKHVMLVRPVKAVAATTVTGLRMGPLERAGQTASDTEGSITVTGLTSGEEYVFTVRAANGVGVGPESWPSNTVAPEAMSRPSPALPAEGARPDIPTFSPRSSPRVKPVRNVGEF